jgi:hypothetical protein
MVLIVAYITKQKVIVPVGRTPYHIMQLIHRIRRVV